MSGSSRRTFLGATAAAGIPQVRLGLLKYPKAGDPLARVAELHAALRDLNRLRAWVAA